MVALDHEVALGDQTHTPDAQHGSHDAPPPAPTAALTLERVADVSALAEAWEVVRSSDAEDGVLREETRAFGQDLFASLAGLSAAVLHGTWRPGRPRRVSIPKSKGGQRVLGIPAVADRVVERSLAAALSPLVDPWLSPCSFAYRPGRGHLDAVRRLAAAREEGAHLVVRADVDDCFDDLPHAPVLPWLARLVHDERVLDLVALLLARPGAPPDPPPAGGAGPGRGLPQGSPLSPLLSNVVLDQLDRRLAVAGQPLVRYADDLALPCADQDEAAAAVRLLQGAVEEMGMRLNSGDPVVMSYEEGFTYLGQDFFADHPPAAPEDEVPDRRVLYVGRQGSGIGLDRGQVVVRKGQEVLLEVPRAHVGRIVTFGAVGVSSGLRAHALAAGVEVVFLSRRGRYAGALAADDVRSVRRRRQQYEAMDDEAFCLAVSSSIVVGKVLMMRALVQRYARRTTLVDYTTVLTGLERAVVSAREAGDLDSLRGVEGAASRTYWEAFAALLPDGAVFEGRRRRPPPDVTNSALSLLYSVLTGETRGALCSVGLDPAVGMMHGGEEARPSLALDVMEEFRVLVVDAVVLDAARRRILTEDGGRPVDGGVYLTDEVRNALLQRYEQRMLATAVHAPSGQRCSYRRALWLQARQVAMAVHHGVPEYRTMTWR